MLEFVKPALIGDADRLDGPHFADDVDAGDALGGAGVEVVEREHEVRVDAPSDAAVAEHRGVGLTGESRAGRSRRRRQSRGWCRR